MAQHQRVIITDDLDGSQGATSYAFSWQGTSYEIDLNDAHRDELLRALEPYITAARKTGSRRQATPGGKRTGEAAAVREWARANGYTVPDRGRIPAEVRSAYDAR
ncbi:Lsr2 family protein [Actinotalea ferrariae]|uniref:histone-like nucleoid-structuring protein Lsr2 n=1 Tax=Actinotalea ferrariae TaxID=1386098 RepID=UPI001C8C67FB|nr:Lsr2 family protein [Actinotalea ferrariae]MBX9246208.1 Lsr2 family protein [Actinotalea ferrariae]